jgi:hypothetical protein
MAALGTMEDNNGCHPATESTSGSAGDAMRDRGVVVLGCVLLALGSLLCLGKASQAKPPEPSGFAASHGPASQRPTSSGPDGAPIADHGDSEAPATPPRPEPERRGPAGERGPSPRPTYQRPFDRPAPGPRRMAEPPATQGAPPVQRPAHEPPALREQGPVGPDRAGYRPQKEQVEGVPSSRPVHERPAPQAIPRHPHGSWSAGKQEDAGSPVQYDKPAGTPGGENVYSEDQAYARPPERAPLPFEPGAAGGFGPEKTPVVSARPEKGTLYKRPVHTGTSASTPDSGHSGMRAEEPAEHRPQSKTLAAHDARSYIGSGARPIRREISGPRSVGLRKEDRAVGSSPAAGPARGQDAAATAAPPGGKQEPAGEQGRLAPFGSTRFLADPLWGERGSLVDLSREALRSVPGGSHDPLKEALYRRSLTQRGPPLEIPSPFLGFVPMLGGAASGAGPSGSGTTPLLAVLALCLISLLYRGRSSIPCRFRRPVTVPRPALERPG